MLQMLDWKMTNLFLVLLQRSVLSSIRNFFGMGGSLITTIDLGQCVAKT